MNISPISISFQGRKNNRAEGVNKGRSRKELNVVHEYKKPAQIKNEIKILQKKLKSIEAQEAAYLARAEKIDGPALKSAIQDGIIDGRAYYANAKEDLKIRVALLKSQL